VARDKHQGKGGGFDPNGWMLTFSDLVTLLLTFFVMLLSMKQPEITRLKAAFSVFTQGSQSDMSFTDQGEVEQIHTLLDQLRPPQADEMMTPDQQLAITLELPGSTQPELVGPLQAQIKLKQDERGTIITLANDLLFTPGRAELSPAARVAIKKVADLIRYASQPISVDGHTDSDVPTGSGIFADNWSLSLARALAVMEGLVKTGNIKPARIRVTALGDTRPLVPNDSAENRALNRRTEIVLLNPEY
jgi:chemotaxis protein MotB